MVYLLKKTAYFRPINSPQYKTLGFNTKRLLQTSSISLTSMSKIYVLQNQQSLEDDLILVPNKAFFGVDIAPIKAQTAADRDKINRM